MTNQASNGAQNRRLSSVLTKSAKASALACLAFALAPSITLAAPATTPAPAVAASSAKTGSVYGKVSNAATGAILTRAKVTVEGTDIETFTDEFGEYRLELPEGTTNIKVSYTGMKDKILDVEVLGGEIMMQDFNIVGANIASTGKGKDEVVMLDAFSVTEGRETNAHNIANNEQRFSLNIKSVVSADAFGDVTEGNVGEFIKYLPGVSVDYVAADVRTINIRGFSSQFTALSFNGMRITSSSSGNNNRAIELEQISINNVARTEVVKAATADTPADALGGSVNMISKNAFERKGISFNYKLYGSVNSENVTLSKKPGPKDKTGMKILPGVDFDLTIPFTKNFGIVLTGLSSNQYNEQHRTSPLWNFVANGATPSAPYLQEYNFQDGPKQTGRNSFNIRADWRVARGHTLSVGYQDNFYNNFFGNRNMKFSVGTSATSATTGGSAFSYSPTFSQSATGRGAVTQGSSYRNKNGQTQLGDILYRFKGTTYEAVVGLNTAKAKTWYRDLDRGVWNNIGTSLQGVSTVRIEGIQYPAPTTLIAKTATGEVIDWKNIANYRINTANTNQLDGWATLKGAFADIKRNFDTSIPFALKTGINVRKEVRDNKKYNLTYDFLGADKLKNTADDSAANYASTSYINQDNYWSLPSTPWVSSEKLADLFKSNPEQFLIQGQGVAAYLYEAQNSTYMRETTSAAYIQGEAKFLHNDLSVVAGVRFEKVQDYGLGFKTDNNAIYQRNADGSFVVSSTGAKVRKTEAGAAGSLQEAKLKYLQRGAIAQADYHGYYPSIGLNYNITEQLIARFAYGKSYGKPDYVDIVPSITVPDSALVKNANGEYEETAGTITASNTALRPWTADNYDFAIAYYPTKGGILELGYFRKDLSDFWETRTLSLSDAAVRAEMGIDDSFSDWTVSSKFNGGNARITGLEFNVVQPLNGLGSWGKYFNVTSNGTFLKLVGGKEADFSNFIPVTGNVGLTFSKKPFVIMVKLNMRGKQRLAKQIGTGYLPTKLATQTADQYAQMLEDRGGAYYEYDHMRNTIDLNFEYQFSKSTSFFANVRNIFNVAQDRQRYNSLTPNYAINAQTEEYGLQFAIGVKGKF